MAIKSKTQLQTDISTSTFTAPQQVILDDMVDSYEDYFPQINTAARNALTPTLNQIIFNTDVNRNEYWNGSAWLGIGQDISTPLVVKIDLSSADILALNTTPITIAAAPGAGFALMPSSMAYRYTFGSAAYLLGGSIELISNSIAAGTSNSFIVISTTVMRAAANRSGSTATSTGTGVDAIVENNSLQLKTSTAFTTGDGTLTVWVTYSIIAY